VNVYVVRPGESAWSLTGQHTGTTDLPLTDNGRRLAERLGPVLAKEAFTRVFVSPMRRARDTCELAGLGNEAVIDPTWSSGITASTRG
jgi:broad specificity phosphatase PhoE